MQIIYRLLAFQLSPEASGTPCYFWDIPMIPQGYAAFHKIELTSSVK